MLGHKLVQELRPNFDTWATINGPMRGSSSYAHLESEKTIPFVDGLNFTTIEAAIRAVSPDVVVNAIGVIKQLPTSQDVVVTLSLNSILVHKLAHLAENGNFKLITVSTDCVFDGQKGSYTEQDLPNALDLYGTSKRLGEVAGPNCLTLRTSIIGRELTSAHSLIEWFLSQRGGTVRGFTKAIYTGLPTIVFADVIRKVLTNNFDLQGLYNVSSEAINKFDLLSKVNARFKTGIDITPSADFVIDRSLDSTRFRRETGIGIPTWDEMIEMMAQDPTPYDKLRKTSTI